MDFNSGSLPLNSISFYLSMATGELSAEIPQLENIAEGAAQSAQTETNGLQVDVRPPSNQSNSSCDTEGSLTAYADQTLRTLAAHDPSLDITFLPVPIDNSRPEVDGIARQKTSMSDVLQKEGNGSQPDSPKEQGSTSSFILKEWTQDKGKTYFATETSEVEELYDSKHGSGRCPQQDNVKHC